MHSWYPGKPEEGDRSPGAGVKDDCEPPFGAGNQTRVLLGTSTLNH